MNAIELFCIMDYIQNYDPHHRRWRQNRQDSGQGTLENRERLRVRSSRRACFGTTVFGRRSGLPFTILQPAPYMQNLLAGWKSIAEGGVLRVPYSINSKFSFVDLEDLAEAAIIVLVQPDHINATYELVGTPPLSHVEVAEIFSRVLKRAVHAEKEEIKDWRLRSKGISEYAVEDLSRMFEYYDEWGLSGNPNVLRWLLRREAASLETFVERTLKERNAVH